MKDEKLHRRKLLGKRLLCINGGLDEEMVRNYIREQECEEERYEQLSLWKVDRL